MKLKYSRLLAIISAGIIFFGAIFFGVGIIAELVQKNREKHCTYKLTATVLDNEPGGSDSNALYPVYYYSYLGKEYNVKSDTGSYPAKFDVGEEVEMYIDPDDPKRFYVPADNTLKIISMVFKIIGGVIAALGLLIPMIIARIKYKKNANSNEEIIYVSNQEPNPYRGYYRDNDSNPDEDYISSVEEYNRYEK